MFTRMSWCLFEFKNLLRAQLFFALCFTIFVYTGCKEKTETISLPAQLDSLPTETAKNIVVLYNDSSFTKARIVAPVMKNFSMRARPFMEMPEGVNMTFYNDSLQVTSTLTAKYAINYDVEKIMEAQKNVVVVNEKGDKLETERLVWDSNKAMFWSDKFVRITRKEEIIEGTGLEANENFSKYTVKNITGILSVQK